ncbi:hypothetical protein SLA2020_477570 [Shorea laevis]
MGSGRRCTVDFTDNSTAPPSRDIPDPAGFILASIDQDDSALNRQKKDAEANWKAHVILVFSLFDALVSGLSLESVAADNLAELVHFV